MDTDDVLTFRALGDVIDGIVRDLEVRTQDHRDKGPRVTKTPGKWRAAMCSGGTARDGGKVPGAVGGRKAPGTNRHSSRGRTVTKGNRRL